jgi:hypothetical protein
MNKVTDFLERHVQWLVLVLALAYVGYMGYAYLYVPPLSVTVGKPPVLATPGDIDEKIVQGPVAALDRAIADKEINPPKVADVLKTFDEKIGEQNVGKVELATNWGSTQKGQIGGTEHGPQENQIVKNLPDAPPAVPVLTQPGSAQWTVALMPGQAKGGDRTDIAYFMGAFTVDMAALTRAINKEFSKDKVPVNLLNAEFVKVDLYRQERSPNGQQWSAPKLIPPLPINVMQPYPGDLKKDPVNQADQKDWFTYEAWAQKNQTLFTHPAFYKTAPDVPAPAITGGGQAGMLAPPAPVAPAVPGFINPAGGGLNQGNGAFNPLNPALQPNFQIVANDATLQEGKVYRYAVRYRLFNPLYTKLALATRDVAEKFDYASPDPTDPKTPDVEQLWTAAVTPEPRAYIFVQKITPFRNEAQFIVFNWKDGHWHETNAPKLNPGDPVSAAKGESRWTLVDVRKDSKSNEPYVIIMDDKGGLEQRSERDDGADPMLIKLKAVGAPPGAPAAAAAR